ncbi:4Fe-4S binding protein [Chloroflexota bacterium]
MTDNLYEQLAQHLSTLGIGCPVREDMEEILKYNFTPEEAEVALALPTRVAPLQLATVDDISHRVNISREILGSVLEELARRGLLFSGKTEKGEKGYALHQVGHGFPQTFFWNAEDTPHARAMALMVAKYFNRQVTREAYASAETKPFRYIPVNESIEPDIQAVYPYDFMSQVIEKTKVIAVAHCPCRVSARLNGKDCGHPTEVCLKFDDMAEYLMERGLGREVSKAEALEIVRKSEEAGLVHFVDNAFGDIKHNCNCCGCVCWNVGTLRRRKTPRDVLMATYFIRETDEALCNGCGDCAEICPVAAVTIEGDMAKVDKDWCIGCGLCIVRCPIQTAKLKPRSDRLPLPDFKQLYDKILSEKGLT